MKNYDHIPLTVKREVESWYQWPQTFSVPKGWAYRLDYYRDYEIAPCDMTFDLCCAGDWLEIVSVEKNERILYEIY